MHQQVLTSLIMLNLAGGTSVDDLRILNADPGFCQILRKVELQGLTRKERREVEKRWRKEKKRFVPSPSAIFRYLSGFHDAEQEKIRTDSSKSSFIPAPNEHLRGLVKVNADLCRAMNTANPNHTVTLIWMPPWWRRKKETRYTATKASNPINRSTPGGRSRE